MWLLIASVTLLIISFIIGVPSFYLIFCGWRHGLAPPTFSLYNPFAHTEYYRGPHPAPGGIVGWVNKKIHAFKNRNSRTPGEAYEELLLSNGRGPGQWFGPLDPDETWDALADTEAVPYGPVGYYEQRELGISDNEDKAYYVERGRAGTPELYVGRNGAGRDKRYAEQMGKRLSKNQLGDNGVKPNNVSLRGVSPKPIDASVGKGMPSWLSSNGIAINKIKIANGVERRLVNGTIRYSQELGSMSEASQSKDAEHEESTTKVIPHTCESCEKILIDLNGGNFLCTCRQGKEYDHWIGEVEDILQSEQIKCDFLLHLLHMKVRKKGKLQGLVKELGGDLFLKFVDDEKLRYNLIQVKTMLDLDNNYILDNFCVYADEGTIYLCRYLGNLIIANIPNRRSGCEVYYP